MSNRHRTDYQIRQIMKYNKDGRPDQQKTRYQSLRRDIRHLVENRGYSTKWDPHNLNKKLISRLVNDKIEKGLSHRTIANSLTQWRWLASKVGREDQIPSNKDLGLRKRSNEPLADKSAELKPEHLEAMDDRMGLINQLKAEFGLREEEAMKFGYDYAIAGPDNYIKLQDSWCKGGRERFVEIVNHRQRALLERVKEYQVEHKEKSLIPNDMRYLSYKKAVQKVSTALGVKGHSFRHQWAHDKFFEISKGIRAPLDGGPKYSELSDEEKQRWDKAAQRVNEELGHGKARLDITKTYIGDRA